MKVSACWIVKNEGKNIRRSIESVKDIVDEIVVVDTGSTDDTVDIAKAEGAEVGYFEWIDDFSAAKNYAMSLVSGEITFFLDADEWFSPKLTQKDRESIEAVFSRPEVDTIQLTIRNLNSQGALKSTGAGCRIIRNRPGLGFQKKVHEQLLLENGELPEIVLTDSWQIDHSGYVEEVIAEKMERNIDLLEASASGSSDPLERNLMHCYLVREYHQRNDIDNSIRHLKIALEEPDLIRRQCIQYDQGFSTIIYHMLTAAADNRARGQLSRKELYRKLVEPFRKYIRQYPGLATIELFYQSLFDIKEDVILSQIGSALEAARKFPDSPVSNYRDAEMIINQRAAEAALSRGKLTDAMNYAVESFRYTQKKDYVSLRVLLCCLRGLPTQEIIFFLNSQFDLNNPDRLEYLSVGTMMHGFTDVHAYYLDKRIKAGFATKEDFLYLLLLYGRYNEAAEAARGLYNEDIADVVNKSLFLTAICSNDKRIYSDSAYYLKDYKHILDAYFGYGGTDTFTEKDYEILVENYGLIALAAGIESAVRFMELFKAQALLCYQVKARYCVENGIYELMSAEPMPSPDDILSNHYLIECLTASGHCEEAVDKIERLLRVGHVDEVLLKFLLAAADRSTGGLKRRAAALYEKYAAHYDLFIDMRDILQTGYVVDDGDKKKAKAYKTLTSAQFNKQLAEDAEKPRIDGFAELSGQVGAVYEEKGMIAAAVECYRLSLAQGHNKTENCEKLAGLFKAMGNNQLAGRLETIK